MKRPGREGAALLEVMVALAILAGAGLSLSGLAEAALKAERAARIDEESQTQASQALAAAALLPRPDLDKRLGGHSWGQVLTDIQRPERTLYRITILDPGMPEAERLVTVVYRPEGR